MIPLAVEPWQCFWIVGFWGGEKHGKCEKGEEFNCCF